MADNELVQQLREQQYPPTAAGRFPPEQVAKESPTASSVRPPDPRARGSEGFAKNKLEMFRAKFPEYRDTDDQELMDALYKRHGYVNTMTPEEFYSRMGVPYTPPTTGDALKGAGRAALELGGAIVAPEAIPGRLMGRGLVGAGERMVASGAGEAAGSLAAEAFDPSEDPLRRATEAGVTGAVGEGVGSMLAKGFQKGVKPLVGKLHEGAEATIDRLRGEGGILTPGLATRSHTMDLVENAAGASLVGGGRVLRTQEKAQEIIQQQTQDFVNRFWDKASIVEAGELIQQAVENKLDVFSTAARAHYRKVDELTAGASVNISGLKAQAKQLQMTIAAGLPSGAPGASQMLKDVMKKPDVVSFADAAALRSDLLSIARGGADLIPGKAKGLAKKLAGDMDRAMQAGAKDMSDDALRAWRTANAFWRKGKDQFNSQLLKSIARKDPEMVFQTAIKNARPNSIKQVRKVVGANTDEWKKIQGQWLNDIFTKSTDVEGTLDGKKFLRQIKGMGDDALKELFPAGADRSTLLELGNALRITQGKPDTGGLRLVVQFAQAGAVAGIFMSAGSSDATSAAAMTLLTPYALSRIITNKTAAKWLSVGLRAPKGSDTAIRATSQLTGWLAREGLLGEEE